MNNSYSSSYFVKYSRINSNNFYECLVEIFYPSKANGTSYTATEKLKYINQEIMKQDCALLLHEIKIISINKI